MHRMHCDLKESCKLTKKKKLRKVSSLNIWIKQTSGYEPLSTEFPHRILVIPGLHDIIEQGWDYPPSEYQGL